MSRFTMLLLLVLVVGACSASESSQPIGDDGPPDPTPDASMPDPEPLPLQDPNVAGPWKAGVKTVQLTDPARNRKISIDVWYPITDATSGSKNTYKLDSMLGTLASIDSPARRNGTPAMGSWPLIVFSH